MQEVISQIISYVWAIWRYRWLALIVAWVCALGGWLFVQQMPESYVATARVYADTSNLLRPLLRGLAIQPDTEQRIAMMSRTLMTRPNLEKVMRMTDLDLQVRSERDQEKMLNQLQRAIKLNGDRTNTSLYAITVSDEDRLMAKRIAQALITVFIESGLSEKRQDSSGAQDFLEQQISEYESRLITAERKLAEFKQRHVGTLPGQSGGFYEQLATARQDLSVAQLQLREAESRRDELQRQLAGEEPVIFSSGSPDSSQIEPRIQALKVQLDALLVKYTERHPEVRQIQGVINKLEAERRSANQELLEKMGGVVDDRSDDYSDMTSSPVYQGLRSMLAETEARVAELQVRVDEYQRRRDELDEKVDNIPVIEAQLKQLNRDYSVIAEQHQALLERREAAKLSEDVESSAGDVTFRVVDPPFVPSKPSEPNKVLLNSIVLVLALGAGIGLALLVSMAKPVVPDAQTLGRLTGLPLLGSVAVILTPEEKKREALGLAAYTSVFSTLILAFVAINVGQVMALS